MVIMESEEEFHLNINVNLGDIDFTECPNSNYSITEEKANIDSTTNRTDYNHKNNHKDEHNLEPKVSSGDDVIEMPEITFASDTSFDDVLIGTHEIEERHKIKFTETEAESILTSPVKGTSSGEREIAFSMGDSYNENLDPDIAEFYSYAPQCVKIYDDKEKCSEKTEEIQNMEYSNNTETDIEMFLLNKNGLGEDDMEIREEKVSRKQKDSVITRGLSDKYDPFISAKRQLEELCSPTSPTVVLISPTTPTSSTSIGKQRTTSLSSSLSTASSNNPRNTLNNVKSNFRRTSSLRVSRKNTSRPTHFTTPTEKKPTIQRGLSDEGPISSNFLKPEEYDEMPVKSVCVNDFSTHLHHSPKVIKRDPHSNPNRRNLRLNLNKTINDKSISSGSSVPLSKTDSLAVFLKYENESKQGDKKGNNSVDLTEKDLKDKTNILSKQSSQKSLSNTCNASSLNDKENVPSVKESLSKIHHEHKNHFRDNSKSVVDQTATINSLVSNKPYPIRLEPLPNKPPSPKMLNSNPLSNESTRSINLSSILDLKDNEYIDPKLINVFDNLPVNIPNNLSDSTSSSTDSASTMKVVLDNDTIDTPNQLQQQQAQRQIQYQQITQTPSNRNSVEKKNLLKRQLRLGKNQFLYDLSPDNDPYSEECDKTISMIESTAKPLSSPSLNEPSFDDFDFEEFLSSFEHDEDQFPIFRDCKEFLLNRSFNKRCNNNNNNLNESSGRSPTSINMVDYNENDDEDGKREIFISIETSQNDSSPSPTDPISPHIIHHTIHPIDEEEVDKNANKVIKFENDQISKHDDKEEDDFEDVTNKNNAKNIMKKIEHELNQSSDGNNVTTRTFDSGTTMYPMDSDEISSVECYPIRRSTKNKQSADSAYGSLSRHSPTDLRQRKIPLRNPQKHTVSIPEIQQQQYENTKYLQRNESKQRNRNFSASSSGSDVSLPNIQPQHQNQTQPQAQPHHHQIQDKEKYYYESELPQSEALSTKKEVRMSKFCHECGHKFLIAYAKFCMECGIKRIVLE